MISHLFGKEQTTRQQPTYNLYNSKMGTELFYQILFPLRELPINQIFLTGDHDYFLTPAGWNTSRVGFTSPSRQGEEVIIDGNFGARKNSYTRANVYSFIWGDSVNPSSGSPSRLPIPQYRNPIQSPFESFDAAYYSLRNSPKPLLNILNRNYLLTTNNMRNVDYGSPRDVDEQRYLYFVAKEVYEYFIKEENEEPYTNWTGASLLRCSNQPNGDIRILFRKPDLSSPVVSYYNPASLIHNEVSLSQSVIGRNGEYTSVDYRIFSNLETDDHSISMSSDYILNVDGIDLPGHRPERMQDLYSNFSVGLPREFPTEIDNSKAASSRDIDLVSVQNYRVRIDTSINNSVINSIGRRRMPRYIAALNKPPFKKSEDICINQEDIFRAESGIQVIQTRLMSFFINVMPLASVYLSWGSIGTTKLITDYLYRKILAELSSREILGAFYESTSYIKLVYPNISDDEEFENNPIILDGLSPEQNMKNIIEAAYLGILSNIQEISEYSELRESVFGQNTITFPRYKNTLVKFYKILGDANTDLESYGIALNNVQITREKIREFYNENELTELGMLVGAYYFPIAFQIASYLIYYDMGIKYSARYSDTNYRTLVETAASDDNLLTSVKGQVVKKFSTRFAGFPMTIDTWDKSSKLLYSTEDLLRRIKALENLPRTTWNGKLITAYRSYLSSLNLSDTDNFGATIHVTNDYLNTPQHQAAIMSRILKSTITSLIATADLDINNLPNNLESSNVALQRLINRLGSDPMATVFVNEHRLATSNLLERIIAGQEDSILKSYTTYESFYNPLNFHTANDYLETDSVDYYLSSVYEKILEEKSILEKLVITNE